MTFLEQIMHADQKIFKKYIIILISSIMIGFVFITWQYYTKVTWYKKKIVLLNYVRQEARELREKMVQVQTQRSRVNTMLEEEADFKIAGYFNNVLINLHLIDNKKIEETSQINREDNYRESELITTLTNLDMKQITELLYEIEQKKRIYIKKLEIEKSKKNKNKLDVNLIIATLLHKEIE
ncbi:hypothetical protein EKK58_03450 [Candidatus Dependentiae bacterium]|nr:MAG: hypothetical protein EKK58_03450 [Candidatus Dependentiae bacterium]